MPTARDLREFRGFLRNATDRQLKGIYIKELRAVRHAYAELVVDEADRRGVGLLEDDDEKDVHQEEAEFAASGGYFRRDHARKKSPAQLDREIAEALGQNGQRHALVGGTRSWLAPGVIRPGDRVTIVDRFGTQRTGRAIMRGPHGWVLNMGGKHGTPAVATDENIVSVKSPGLKDHATKKTAAHATKRVLPPLKRISTTAGDFDSYLAVHRDPMNDREFRLSWYSLDGTGSIGERGLTQSGFRSEGAARAYAKQHYGGDPVRVPAWGVGPDMTAKVQAAHPDMTKKIR